MMTIGKGIGGLLVFFALCAAGSGAQAGKLTSLAEIIPTGHLTEVEGLGARGAEGVRARIVQSVHDTGNAHGNTTYQVLIQDAAGRWSAVRFTGAHGGETQMEIPHTGEDMVKSVRFFRARFDQAPATVAIVAARDLANVTSYYDAAPETVDLYLLTRHAADGGFAFDSINSFRLKGQYVNADCGIAKESGVPLGPSRQGACSFDEQGR